MSGVMSISAWRLFLRPAIFTAASGYVFAQEEVCASLGVTADGGPQTLLRTGESRFGASFDVMLDWGGQSDGLHQQVACWVVQDSLEVTLLWNARTENGVVTVVSADLRYHILPFTDRANEVYYQPYGQELQPVQNEVTPVP